MTYLRLRQFIKPPPAPQPTGRLPEAAGEASPGKAQSIVVKLKRPLSPTAQGAGPEPGRAVRSRILHKPPSQAPGAK